MKLFIYTMISLLVIALIFILIKSVESPIETFGLYVVMSFFAFLVLIHTDLVGDNK